MNEIIALYIGLVMLVILVAVMVYLSLKNDKKTYPKHWLHYA
jgi:hypothetical protein